MASTPSERLYDVHWERPQPIEGVRAESGHVLYQLTGRHSVYGSDTLLYIGQTQREDARARLAEHVRTWAALEPDQVHVRLASVGEFVDWEAWMKDRRQQYPSRPAKEIVDSIERLLIYVHQPAYNSREKKRAVPLPVGHLRVFNTGVYGSLLPELSTRRYIDVVRTPDDPT